MGLNDDEYKIMGNFKLRVLDLAVNEINEKTDLTVSYTQEKKGRVIHGFKFVIKQKPPQKAVKNERDLNTVDMFATMTDKQIAVFSRKLAQLPELGSNAPLGKTMDEFIQIIANDLKDEKKQAKYKPYLEKLGFKWYSKLTCLISQQWHRYHFVDWLGASPNTPFCTPATPSGVFSKVEFLDLMAFLVFQSLWVAFAIRSKNWPNKPLGALVEIELYSNS